LLFFTPLCIIPKEPSESPSDPLFSPLPPVILPKPKSNRNMYKTLLTEKQDKTLIVTLNRPDKLNALNQTVMSELDQVMDEFLQDKQLRGAILTGAGEKSFAAGADIKEFQELDRSAGEALSKRGQDIFFKIESSPKPVIAAVNGFALGGGCELAMACHMRVATGNAMFGQPEVKLGLLAGYGGTQRLTQLIGKARATELLITADMINAEVALDYGLINYLTNKDELLETCLGILKKTYKQSPNGIALTLQAIQAGVNNPDGYQTERQNFGQAIVSEEAKEGVAAFLEKRKPNF
jgi:enoyl-CoA hydratase